VRLFMRPPGEKGERTPLWLPRFAPHGSTGA
jgi:hypothetical protein